MTSDNTTNIFSNTGITYYDIMVWIFQTMAKTGENGVLLGGLKSPVKSLLPADSSEEKFHEGEGLKVKVRREVKFHEGEGLKVKVRRKLKFHHGEGLRVKVRREVKFHEDASVKVKVRREVKFHE